MSRYSYCHLHEFRPDNFDVVVFSNSLHILYFILIYIMKEDVSIGDLSFASNSLFLSVLLL